MNTPSPALAAAISSTKLAPNADKLDRLREAAKRLRNLKLEAGDLEARLESRKGEIDTMVKSTLPALFEEAGVMSIGIEAEGNMPAYEAKAWPYYHANIKADWEPEKKNEAFTWLTDHGHGDLIKAVITIEFGQGEYGTRKKVEDWLRKSKVLYTNDRTVPWASLTAFVKEQITKHNTIPPLETLGATVGKVVKLKPL
jgi:IS1 family transposase